MYDFISIDFETANNNLNSACSVGLAAVCNNKIVDEKYFLIKPPNMHFNEKNIEVHGITPDQVINSPTFPEVWNEIKQYFINSNFVIAHNAVFDMSVLKNSFTTYNIEAPDFDYLCSIPISNIVCGTYVSSSLSSRSEYFNIELDHHNALSDARACADLVIKCVQGKKCKSIMSYVLRNKNIQVKQFSDLNPLYSFGKNRTNYKRVKISEVVSTNNSFDESHTFYNKSFVFTGELKDLSRKEAMQKVVDLGGIVRSGVSRKTDYLIVGLQDKSIVGVEGISSKERKAHELISNGINIKILDENDFINSIENT